MAEKNLEKKQREFYIYTMILTPSVLLGLVSSFMPDWTYRLVSQAILLFLQGVLLKGIIESK